MHMIATKAIHKLGDISRPLCPEELMENLCYISGEDDENYIGSWVLGFGFFNVKFPKETTRKLTQEEIDFFNTQSVRINNQPSVRLKVD